MSDQTFTLAGVILLLGVVISTSVVGCRAYPRYSNEVGDERPVIVDTEPEDEYNPSGSTVDERRMARIIDYYLGTPYQRGGYNTDGIDCSGLVRTAYYELDGRSLPPTVRKMYRAGSRVERDELAFGDLVFFAIDSRYPTHVGIYVENDQFVHASESRGVIISSLDDDYYDRYYLGARRPD